MIDVRRGPVGRLFALLALPLLSILAACGGGGGGGECTTCPPPPPTTGTLSLEIAYEPAGDLAPAGFKQADVIRVDVAIVGPSGQVTQSLGKGVNRAAFDVKPGAYSVSATAFGTGDIVLFTSATQATVTAGETTTTGLEMGAALGTVTLEIDGETSGTIDAVASEGVPFVVTVRNTQNRPVSGSTVRLSVAEPGYGTVAFDGSTQTDAQGRATGTIDARHSGELDLVLEVDGRPIANPGPTHVVFATGVDAANSAITQTVQGGPTLNGSPISNGQSFLEFTVLIKNQHGEALPGVPVTPTSWRNAGLDPAVDLFEPANGYESGVTDAKGEFRFTVRTFTSSFFELDEAGRLRSREDGTFANDLVEFVADGVKFDQRPIIWNSPVHPNLGGLNTTKQFVTANGQDSATIIVDAQALPLAGGGPVANAFVELVDVRGNVLNQTLHIVPESGFEGFRTNAQGEWRGRLTSTTKGTIFFGVKVDGRGLITDPPLRSVIFQ